VFGDYSNAEKYYRASLKREPKYYRARKGLAELYLRFEKYSRARREFDALLKINPDSAAVRVKYALSVFRGGNIQEGEKEFKKVLLMTPGNLDAMWYLSKLYKDSGKLKDAMIMWLEIKKKGPENNKWYDFARNYIAIYQSKLMR
jgi:Tfp pilus assembly protein PilF